MVIAAPVAVGPMTVPISQPAMMVVLVMEVVHQRVVDVSPCVVRATIRQAIMPLMVLTSVSNRGVIVTQVQMT
jgi:hypothetical protein